MDECFKNDSLFNRIGYILNQENGEDSRVLDVISGSYEVYCEFFQTVAAQLDSFPSVRIKELPGFFRLMGLIENEE